MIFSYALLSEDLPIPTVCGHNIFIEKHEKNCPFSAVNMLLLTSFMFFKVRSPGKVFSTYRASVGLDTTVCNDVGFKFIWPVKFFLTTCNTCFV